MSLSLSLILVCVWIVVANVIAFFPSKRQHWPSAYVLITLGIPLLIYFIYENGPWLGILVLLAGMSILRWPVFYLAKWLRRLFRRGTS